MKIINQSVELMNDFDGEEVLKFIEKCGRVCYKSEKNIKVGSAEKFIKKIIKCGHESVLEHFSVTFKIICDRGVSHELVRHRLASYSQESTRYCKYDELTFVKPFYSSILENSLIETEQKYFRLLDTGFSPQQARAVLPNALKTEVIMTANLREWRHILKLRTSKKAHPQMREVANMILKILRDKLPVIFGDIGEGDK